VVSRRYRGISLKSLNGSAGGQVPGNAPTSTMRRLGETRTRSRGALAGGFAGRAGAALARGAALASRPATAGPSLIGGGYCCGRIRIEVFGRRVHL